MECSTNGRCKSHWITKRHALWISQCSFDFEHWIWWHLGCWSVPYHRLVVSIDCIQKNPRWSSFNLQSIYFFRGFLQPLSSSFVHGWVNLICFTETLMAWWFDPWVWCWAILGSCERSTQLTVGQVESRKKIMLVFMHHATLRHAG